MQTACRIVDIGSAVRDDRAGIDHERLRLCYSRIPAIQSRKGFMCRSANSSV
jgi:hypothetical protein